jgi:hypothetical protein
MPCDIWSKQAATHSTLVPQFKLNYNDYECHVLFFHHQHLNSESLPAQASQLATRDVFDWPAQAFAELRAQYTLLLSLPSYHSTPDPDTAMRQSMELKYEQQWLDLADYLIKQFALQRRLLADSDA